MRLVVVRRLVVDHAHHVGDGRAGGGGAEAAGPVALVLALLVVAPADGLHRGRAAPVGRVLRLDLRLVHDRVLLGVLPAEAAPGAGRRGELGVSRREVGRELDALDLVAQHPDLADRAGSHRQLGALGRAARGRRAPAGAGEQAVGVEAAGALGATGARLGLEAGGEGLAALVGPAEAEAVALSLEGGAPHGRASQRRTPLRAVERGALGQHAVDLAAHLGRQLAAPDGPRRLRGLGGRGDPVAVRVVVGQEGDRAERERERGRRDRDGVAPERTAYVVAGDAVGEDAGQEARRKRGRRRGRGRGRSGRRSGMGEGPSIRERGRLTVLSGPRRRKFPICPMSRSPGTRGNWRFQCEVSGVRLEIPRVPGERDERGCGNRDVTSAGVTPERKNWSG